MADKNIGSLPAASTVDDDSLLVAEQQGQAVKVTGAQFKGFAQQAVRQYVEQAQEAASDALEASEQALEAVAGIGTAVEDTKANKEAASIYSSLSIKTLYFMAHFSISGNVIPLHHSVPSGCLIR